MSLIDLTATELLSRISSGEITAAAVTGAFLRRIEEQNAAVGAFLSVDHGRTMAQAEEIDRRRAAGRPVGRLGGLPVAVKDVLCTQGEPTTCASRILKEFSPAVRCHGHRPA